MSDLYDQALARIDGYLDAVDAVDGIRHARRQLTRGDVRARQRDIIDSTIVQVLAGAPVPDDLGHQLVSAEAAAAEAFAAEQAVDMLEDAAQARLRHLKTNSDPALGFLAGALDDLMADVLAAHEVCGTITSAADAVSAGGPVLDGWRAIQEAAGRYDAIRQAQWQVIVDADGLDRRERRGLDLGPTVDRIAVAGLYANVVEWHPRWRRLLNPASISTGMNDESDAGTQEHNAPWPEPHIDPRGVTAQIWPTTNRPAFVRWLAAGPARPWVPTMDQMRAKADEVARQVREASHGSDRTSRARGWTST